MATEPQEHEKTQVSVGGLMRGSGYAGAASLWQILTRIFLTPLILAKLGLEGYGVWALLFSMATPVTMVGASFGLAYTKFTAEHDARQDYAGLNALLGSAMILVGGTALVGLSALWVLRAPVLAALGVPAELSEGAGVALLFVVLTILLQLSLGCVRQVVAGLQRIDLQYKATILSSAVYFGLAMILLNRGLGLAGLGVSYLAGELVGIGLCGVWCRALRPELRLSPWRATRADIRRVLSLGGRFQALYVLTQISGMGFRMLLSALLGPASLGTYQLAVRLIRLAETGAGALLAPMMPAFASLHSAADRTRMERLYRHGSTIVFAVALASFGFLSVFADRLLLVWTGQDVPLAAWTIRVLSLGFVVKHLTGMGTASLRGQGRLRLELGYSVVTLLVVWVLLGPGYWLLGYRGFILASTAGLVVGGLWFLVGFARQENVPLRGYLREAVLRPLVLLAPPIALVGLAGSSIRLPLPITHLRWEMFAELAVWGSLLGVVTALIFWHLVLAQTERDGALSAVRGLWSPRTRRSVEP